MKPENEMARTKVQLDTSLEVENRQGLPSYVNNNDGVLAEPLLVTHGAYIYRYIDSEFLTRKRENSTFPAYLLASASYFACLFLGLILTRKISDAHLSEVQHD